MRSIEVQAKTVDEAIFKGLDEMGLSIDEVDIEILEEGGKRFLGMGSKQCLVRLSERDRSKVHARCRKTEQTKPAHKEQKTEPRQSRPPQDRKPRPRLQGERIAAQSQRG